MRHLLMLVLAPAALLLPGCPLAPGCGVAYSGAGDQLYMRGADSLLVCDNGGYVASVAGKAMEGLYADTGIGTIGATGAFAFQLAAPAEDGTRAGLGDGTWTPVALDQTALDHADVQCTDLATRSWWTADNASFLPVATAFAKPIDGFTTVDACAAAQAAGTIPATASCEDELLLCPDGSAQLLSNDTHNVALRVVYASTSGTLVINLDNDHGLPTLTGTFDRDGTFVSNPLNGPATSVATWHAGDVGASGMHCN